MKKVILSAYACSPIRGSEPGNGWNWAVNLAKLGYDVWCFTNVEDKDEIIKEKQKIALNNLRFIFVALPFGLDKLLLDTSSKTIYFHYYLWSKRAGNVAQGINNEIKFDIAHHVTFGSLQQGTFLWRLKNVKLIFGPVGGGQEAPVSFKKYFGNAWRAEVIRNYISKLSFRFNTDLKKTLMNADQILVTNRETENLIKSTKYYNASKVHFVLDNALPYSMENMDYTTHNYHNPLKLLWVGRMLPRKGLNLVLHALSFIPAYVDYKLTIVGGGEQFKYLAQWINDYNIDSKKLNILGQIPFDKVAEQYTKSEVFVFCSLRDSCPAQLIEAMAFGLPPIVLNIHGSALSVPDNCGIKVNAITPVETAENISKAIEKLYNNKNLLLDFSQAAYKYAQTNTWKAKVQNITSSYY